MPLIAIEERSDIGESSRAEPFAADHAVRNCLPIDRLQRVEARDEILVETQHAQELLGLEGDVGIDEEEMRRLWRVEEFRDDDAARARDQRIIAEEREIKMEAFFLGASHHIGLVHQAAIAGGREQDDGVVGTGLRRKVVPSHVEPPDPGLPRPDDSRRVIDASSRIGTGSRAISKPLDSVSDPTYSTNQF